MKKVGIWLDKVKAYVITLHNHSEKLTMIYSEIKPYHIVGGSGTRLKGGPQDVVQDSKYLEREKHDFNNYFKKIIENLKDADAIVIFGPAEAGEKLNKKLQQEYKPIANKITAVKKADSMTLNQTKALIKGYFKKYSTGL